MRSSPAHSRTFFTGQRNGLVFAKIFRHARIGDETIRRERIRDSGKGDVVQIGLGTVVGMDVNAPEGRDKN